MLITILIILAVAVAGVLVATKFGFFTDADNNGIPDKVDEKIADVKVKVEDIKEDVKEVVVETKKRVKKVKEEIEDVKKAAKQVVKQTKDVAKAATTKTTARKGRKPKK